MTTRGGDFMSFGSILRHAQARRPPDLHPSRIGVVLSDVRSKPVLWLWPGRIPRGKITVLDGDPGLGKSTLMLDLAARLSRGQAMPGLAGGSQALDGGVVLISAEDDPADTIRPRLEAAGADLDRIRCLAMVPNGEDERLLELPADLLYVEQAIRHTEARLVVFDPFVAFLGAEVNSHRDQDVRRALAPLAKMAARSGAAVVIIRHWTKAPGGQPLYRGGGSIGIIGAARSGLVVASHPDDPELRVLAATKSNLGPPVPSLTFRIRAETGQARIEWIGESGLSAEALLAARPSAEERRAVDEAAEVLKAILREGPIPAGEVTRQAQEAGISERTLKRAKSRLGVNARRQGYGAGGRWTWALPDKGGQKCP